MSFPLIQNLRVPVFSQKAPTPRYYTYHINSKPLACYLESSPVWPLLTFPAVCLTEDPSTGQGYSFKWQIPNLTSLYPQGYLSKGPSLEYIMEKDPPSLAQLWGMSRTASRVSKTSVTPSMPFLLSSHFCLFVGGLHSPLQTGLICMVRNMATVSLSPQQKAGLFPAAVGAGLWLSWLGLPESLEQLLYLGTWG